MKRPAARVAAPKTIFSPLVSKTAAEKNPTHHSFIAGHGYLAHSGPPELPANLNGKKNCSPAPTAADGSLHKMIPPNGHSAVIMRWLPAHKAWGSLTPAKGNRLAWPADHLQRAGWEYGGPAILGPGGAPARSKK